MNDLDNELSRTLQRRADNLSAVPLAFDDVRGKATSIRRRRQLATGLGVAAAIAVIVPTAMFASQNINADSDLPAVGTPTIVDTNTATPSVTPTMGVDPDAIDVTDLPTGAAPANLVLTNGDLAAAELDGALVRWTSDGVVVEADGQSFGPYPSSHGITRNAAATAVAWATDEGDVMVWAAGSHAPFTISTDFGPTDVRVAAVTGTNCQQGEATDCVYYISRYDMETNQQESVRMGGDGSVAVVDPDRRLMIVKDATDDGRVMGITSIDESLPGSCSAVLDPAETGSTPLWDTCEHTLEKFSPNGDYILAGPKYQDGRGPNVIAIYDAATGEVLTDRSNRSEGEIFYNDAVWEDDTHVLFSVWQDGQWSIVRMDVRGAMEFAVAPQDGGPDDIPFRFETR